MIFLKDSVENDHGINYSAIWEFLPVSEVDSIVMMCFNALKTHITNPTVLSTVPANVVLVEYGFQVFEPCNCNLAYFLEDFAGSDCTTFSFGF